MHFPLRGNGVESPPVRLPFPVLIFLPIARLAPGAEAPAPVPPPAVTARLSVPPAEINVIGDPVTLTWHFSNAAPKPMAFVWEACCRLNGRLTVSEGGVDLPRIPPGPAAAHAFAKPAIILPGRENAFESMLADWVDIRRTGRYAIRGAYVGVLPEQKPPYPRSVELWRGEAATTPVDVALTSVDDYLAQRERRAAQRGLHARVTGPARFPAAGELTLQLHVRNTGPAALAWQWPLDADLWIVDATGRRIQRKPTKPAGTEAAVVLATGAEWSAPFAVTTADLNGSPFGDYRVFVDFPGQGNRGRVPAQPWTVRWELDAAETAALLNAAAANANPRNPPLRQLRQYLGPLAPVLAAVPESSLTPPGAALRRQLQLAACLVELPVRIGRITLPFTVSAGGSWRCPEPLVTRCAPGDLREQVRAVVGVRRHLNAEFDAQLQPGATTTAADLRLAATDLADLENGWAAPPRLIGLVAPGNVPGAVTFPRRPAPANGVLRLSAGGDAGLRATVAWSTDGQPAAADRWPAWSERTLAAPADFEAHLASRVQGTPQLVIVADARLPWRTLQPWLEPVLQRGWQAELVTRE